MADRGDQPPGRHRKLAGILGLLAVAVTIPLAGELLRDTSELERERPPVDPLPAGGIVYSVDFADRQHGFALRGRCLRYWQPDCVTTLLATQDGASWSARPIRAEHRVDLDGPVLALGSCRVAVGARAAVRLFSTDCGRTWRPVSLKPRGTVDALPPGALLESPCYRQPEYVAGCTERRLLVNLPATGRRAWLAGPAPLERPRAERIPAADGGWWVSGRDPATGGPALAVSRDDGRSWSVRRLPEPRGDAFRPGPMRLSVTAHGRDVYVAAVGQFGRRDQALLGIFRSTDDGAHWRQTWQTDGGAHPRDVGGVPVAGGDGAVFLVTADGQRRYRSVDGALTFHRVILDEPIGWPRWTRAGYVARSGEHPERWYLSSSGEQWVRLALPLP